MLTRRKSKAAEPDPAVFQITLPDDVDEDALSKLLPDINLTSLSSDDILSIYQLLLSQLTSLDSAQRERDEALADTERKDIELDQALQDKESLTNDLESSVESVHKELQQTKQERDQLAEDKIVLQNQITSLSASQLSSTSESTSLKERVGDTEREKRELVGVISRLKDESSQREEEIQSLRTNLKEARQEHQTLEAQVRELRSIETSTKFKVDSLTQQLHLSQTEAERANQDLSEKTEEFTKYRRTKHTENVALQSSLDSLTQSHFATEASFKALQSAHTTQAHQLVQALSKVQALTGQLAEQEARYSNEANGLRRLVDMMEEREKQAKEIVENIEHEWATVGEKAERREAILKAETERERKGRGQAEKRVEQLENVLERMGRGELPVPGHSMPSTSMRASGNADLLTDGMMGLSPTVAMASKAQRTGKTFTEVYADFVQLQEEYAKKSAEYDHMDRTLSSVLAQIEERAPILSQQRLEYERLQSEASQLGSQLAQALAEGETSSNFAREQTQKLAKLNNENALLQKQLGDLGRQVQTLVRDIARRDDPTIPPDEELENVPVALDTESLITNNLVAFKSIDGLQQKNQALLKIVRELGQEMENEEKAYREAMEKEQAEAIREAHEAMQELAAQLERQKTSSDSIIQAYVKERDTLRAMLARSEKTSAFPQAPTLNGAVVATEQTDLAKELEDVHGQFEAYRKEMGVDSGRLRDELIAAQREVNQTGAVLAKANAKIEYLTDRQRMNEEQFQMHNQELNELTKRNRQLLEQWTRIDIECNRVSEDLHLATGRLEQLRNENANLRAEKKIWESVQGRLVEENRTLAMERSHLSDLMNNVQKMHNDLERSGENDRRRLESQLQILENQTQDLRGQVQQERDSVRNISLQKDIELKDLQHRLDKHALEFSRTREALVEAQTSRKHLEERVDDLTRQAKGNEEKLAVYERRSGSGGAPHPVDPAMTREQQLEAEVAELRSALKVTEVDLAAARSHKEQFQEISQASETALAALNTTFDEYKTSTETQIARHESECKSLQGRLEETTVELLQIRGQHNEILKSFETERTAWINDKKTLEDTIVDMSTSEKHSESDRSSWEEGMRALEKRAKAAEGKYSNEVVAHAESIKTIEALKKDLATSQAASRESLIASETAQAKLLSSETSWKQQKEALDKEMVDLNARCQDLSSQNTTLHQHLESVSTQATRIRQAADASVAQPEGEEVVEDADSRLSELRSVVSYLRKEKGIVDLQLEMSKQENERLKAHIERLTQTLQETRATLSDERERAIDNTASAAQHAELVERMNQLNILRESNVTLRTECESASKKARDLEARLKQLSQELEPAKEEARAAQAELTVTKIQMERLDGEVRRWQERNTQLLSKYERIDPAEVQALNDEIARLKAEAAAAEAKKKEAESDAERQAARLTAVEDNFRAHKDAATKNSQGFRTKMGELNKQISTSTEEKRQLEAKVSSLEQENSTLRASLASKPTAPGPSSAPASVSSDETEKLITSLRAERDKLLAEKESWNKPSGSAAESGPAPSEWEAEKTQLLKARDEALEKLKVASEEMQKGANENRNIKLQTEKFQTRISDMMKAKAADAEKQAAAITEAVEKAKADMSSSADPAAQETLQKRHAEELRSLEENLTSKYEADLKTRVESAVAEALKAKPTTHAEGDQKAAIDAAIADYEKQAQARRDEEIASAAARHAEEIASAVDRGRMEQAAKGKLKDSQLVKAQKRVKELEALIHEREAQHTELPSISSTAAATSSAAQTTASTSDAGPSQPKPIPTAPAGTNSGPLSRRSAPTGPGRGGTVRGVGRGVPSGPGRGAARLAPVKPTAPSPASVTPTVGVSIIGAAAKRPREESSEDQSLVKRMKAAEP